MTDPQFETAEDQKLIEFSGAKDTLKWPLGKWKRLALECSKGYVSSNGNIEIVERFMLDRLRNEGVTDPLIINDFRARTLGKLQDHYEGKQIPESGPARSGLLQTAHGEYERGLHAYKLRTD